MLFALVLVCLVALALLGPLPGANLRLGAAEPLAARPAGVWPAAAVAVELVLYPVVLAGSKKAAALALTASLFASMGAVLWVQSGLEPTAGWAYSWTLVPVAIGFGVTMSGWRSGRQEASMTGSHLMLVGGVLYTVFGVGFELASGLSGISILSVEPLLLQVLLTGLAVLLLARSLQTVPVSRR